jgi:MOSC domain-containing protein YiiM
MTDIPSEGDFSLVSLNRSEIKGVAKTPEAEICLRVEWGVEGDAHSGPWHRQVSLLALEEIEEARERGIEVKPGDFAENITTSGVRLHLLPVGTRLCIGDTELEVTQIGKECHSGCAVFKAVGDCVMPKRGIFAKVIRGGRIHLESPCHYRV